MNCGNIGKIVEITFELEAIKRNFIVSLPTTTVAYDMIIEKNGKTHKIQIKKMQTSKNRCTHVCIAHTVAYISKLVRTRYTTKYTKEQIDFFALYKENDKSFFIIPFKDVINNKTINISYKSSKYNKYKNAWNLINE